MANWSPPVASDREVARKLAETIDRAMQLGLMEHADRVAESAARLANQHPLLAERLARLRLAQGDAEAALTIIESCHPRPASLRLLRCFCLLRLGQHVQAHLDLHEWSARASAPLQARLLLALLEWRGGDQQAAIEALLHNLKQLEDPHSLAALMLICHGQGRIEQGQFWARRLQKACPWDGGAGGALPELEIMLQTLGIARRHGEAPNVQLDAVQTDRLVNELLSDESVIPALVESQSYRPNFVVARLLRDAIERALPELDDAAAGYESLVRLSVVLRDDRAANMWVERGLSQHPLSAGLARLAQELHAERAIAAPRDVLATIGEPARSEPASQERAA